MSPKLLNSIIILSILGIVILSGIEYVEKRKIAQMKKVQLAQKEQLQKQIQAQKVQTGTEQLGGTKQSKLVDCGDTYLGSTPPQSISYSVSTEKNLPENSSIIGLLQNFNIPGMEALKAQPTQAVEKKGPVSANHTFLKIPSDTSRIQYKAMVLPTTLTPSITPAPTVEKLTYSCTENGIETQIFGLSYKILPSSDISQNLQWTSQQMLPIDIPFLSNALQFNSSSTITKVHTETIFGVATEVADVSVAFSSPTVNLSTLGVTNENILTYSVAKGIGLLQADITVQMDSKTVYRKKIALTGLKR